MTIKTRLIILAGCVALFLVVVPFIILFSLGYRIDVKHFTIVATGGIYVKAEPQPATITIDGAATTTGLLNGYVFVQNLIPGTHNITIKKLGYFDYQKTLEVAQKQVTKLERVTLFKKDPVFEILPATDPSPFNKKTHTTSAIPKTATAFDDYYSPINENDISPDGQKLLFCNNHEILYTTATDPKTKQFLNRFSETIKDCQWLNNDYLIFTLNDKITISELDTRGNINIVSLPSTYAKASADKQTFIPPKIQFNQQDKKLYVLTGTTTLVSERLLP